MGWAELAPFLLAIVALVTAIGGLRERTAASDVRLIQAQEARIKKLEDTVERGQLEVNDLRAQIDHLEHSVAERDRRIIILEHDLAAAQERIRVLEAVPAAGK